MKKKNKVKDTQRFLWQLMIGLCILLFSCGWAVGYMTPYYQEKEANYLKEKSSWDTHEDKYTILLEDVKITVTEEDLELVNTYTNRNDDSMDSYDDGYYYEEEAEEYWEEDTQREDDIYRNSTEEEYVEESVEKVVYGARQLELSDDEMWELARIIYLENGRVYPECTYTTVKYTADVLLNRLQQWGYADVYEVIWDAGQYSTANNYDNIGAYEEGWNISWAALYDALENPDYTPVFQAMFPQGNVYYTDPYTGESFGY